MKQNSTEKDLFGNPIPKIKSKLHRSLEKYNRNTFSERLKRLEYVNAFLPKDYWLGMSLESYSLFSEIKMAFINGEFVSTILLAVSFAEHWFGEYLKNNKYPKESYSTLFNIINTFREKKIIPEYLLKKIDNLRRIRNPFVHLKEWDHPDKLDQRVFLEKKLPYEILEEDAKAALVLIYQIVLEPSPM